MKPRSRSAFTLVEVTHALGVAAFCLLAIVGLLPIGLTTNQNASEQTAAAGVATAISADLHSDLAVSGTTSRFGLKIPAAGNTTGTQQTLYFSQDGNTTGVVGTDAVGTGSEPSRYRATITMTAASTSSGTPLSNVFNTWIFITWPALADGSHSNPPSHFTGSYETVTTLDCN